jgi:hypothetical protein
MLTTTINRVPLNTTQAVNSRIEAATGARLRYCAGSPLRIERRLRELDREWDIERVLETNASVVSLLGLVLGTAVNRRWLFVPAAVTAFLFQHAVQGWCPPLPILRRIGVRTSREIEIERVALKILRGDFDERAASLRNRRLADDVIRVARA